MPEQLAMDPSEHISLYLDRVRRRLRLMLLVRWGGLFCAVSTVLLLLLLLLAPLLERPALLQLGGAALLVLGAGALLFYLGLQLHRLAQDPVVARYIGGRLPALRSDLLSTVELRRDAAAGGFSQALVQALAVRTWTQLRTRPPRALVPGTQLRPIALLLTGSALGWALLAAGLPGHLERGGQLLLAIAAPRPGNLAETPQVGDISLTYTYPEHMGRPPRKVEGTTGQITAPPGTIVALRAVPQTPLTGARLQLSWRGSSSPARQELTLGQGPRLEGSLRVAGEGHYRFALQVPGKGTVLDPVERPIDLEQDAVPRVTLFAPPDGLEVTPRHRLELGFSAEDDYGLSAVDLVYQVEGGPKVRTSLWRPAGQRRARTAADKTDWDLGLVELTPGARVSYWVEAKDNDTISGPKLGRSETRLIKIFSAKEKIAETLQQHQQLLDLAVRTLGDRLLLYEEEPALTATLRLEQAHAVHRGHSTLVDALRDLRNRLRQDNLAPKATQIAIGKIHEQMSGLVQAESSILRGLEPTRRRREVRAAQLAPLKGHNRELVEEMERDVLQLADLLDEQRLQDLMTLQKQLKESREQLGELLERYKKSRDEQTRQQLLRQIARMERQLAELMAKVAQLRQMIPDEYLNPEALEQMDLAAELAQLSQLVRQGQLDQLEQQLASLDSKLQQMQQLLESNLQQYRDGRMGPQEKQYAKALDQLRGLEAEQRQLARRTDQIIRRYRRQATQLMRSKIAPFIRKEQAKLEALRRRVDEIDAGVLAPYDQEQLERVKQRVADLRQMLDQGDLDEALQMARRTQNGLEVLQDDIADEVAGQSSWRKRRLRRSLRQARQARQLAEEIHADLEAIFPDPQSLLDGKDQRELRQLRGQQQALRGEAQRLGETLAKEQQSPILTPELSQGLQEATEQMEKAAGKLRSVQPQEALGAQQAAADRLARLQQQLRQARQPQSWGGQAQLRPRERIEIPGADAFRPPREFREDLLEAMKEPPPEPYEKQVKQYYEELVR